ncbi:MAG: hypothetical protein GY838_19345 [bacterium]|nr:hypothetical protein [bacterium]
MSRARTLRILLALAVLATAGWFLRDYTTDDTFIHLRYAGNLLDRGEFSFNPGEATYGATSPLWIFVLAFFLKLGLAPLTAAWVAGALAGTGVLLLADAIIERLTFPSLWKTAALLLIAVDAWFLRWTFSGMETPLATLLTLLLLWPLVSGRDLAWGLKQRPLWARYLAWGVAAGMVGLVRPEMLLVAPLALPWLLWFEYFRAGGAEGPSGRWRARPHAPLLAAACGWLVVTGPWFVYARLSFGRFLPETAAAKSATLSLDPLSLLANLGRSLQQLAATQGFLYLAAVAVILVVLFRNARDEAATMPVGRWPMDYAEKEEEPEAHGAGPWSVWGPVALVGITATWTVALLGGYALKQVWIISRYLAPLLPVILLALMVVAEWLCLGPGARSGAFGPVRRVLVAGLVLTVLLNSWLLGSRIVPHARDLRAGLEDCYLDMGDWLRENAEPDATVAALDIGALGWSSERRILDLMGLISPGVLELGLGLGFTEMVESGVWVRGAGGPAPRYCVDRSLDGPRWADRTVGGVHFVLLETCVMHGVGLREPQPWTVALYRLDSGASRVKSSAGG